MQRSWGIEATHLGYLIQVEFILRDQFLGMVQSDVQQIITGRTAHFTFKQHIELSPGDACCCRKIIHRQERLEFRINLMNSLF